MTPTTALLLASLASMACAHGFVDGFRVNGKWYGGWDPSYQYNPNSAPKVAGWSTTVKDNGFVSPLDYSSPDIICHRGAAAASEAVTAPAGASIDVSWNTWPDSHHGPVMTSMAACNGACSSADKSRLNFFPIDAKGWISGSNPGTWASDNLIKNNFTSSFKIPTSIKAGEYVVRHEILALHSAGQDNGAQNYPQCLTLAITGGGSTVPAGKPVTQFYKASDPGVKFNLYTSFSSYPIPGPTVSVK